MLTGSGFTTNSNHDAFIKINQATECKVTEHSLTEIKCITQPDSTVPPAEPVDLTQLYRGGHGLIRSIYYGTASIGGIRDSDSYFINPAVSG